MAGLAFDLATLALAVNYLTALATRAAGAYLQTDECFHATVSEWIATHHRLPRTLPELYSGFYYFYPPLFHVLGALWTSAFGAHAFRFLNVFVTALLMAVVWLGCRRLGAPAAGRWAVSLCVASSAVSIYALRLYVEQLTTLLAAAALILILRGRDRPTPRTIVTLGVVIGLAILAKHTAFTLVAFLVAAAIAYAIRGLSANARGYALAAGIATLVAAPMFLRNQVLYGSALYPVLAPDLHPVLHALNRRVFTPQPMLFYRQIILDAGPAITLMVVAGIVSATIQRRWSMETALLGFCLVAVAVAPFQPLLESRHLLPAVVGAATLASIIVAQKLEHRPAVAAAIGIGLLAWGTASVVGMPASLRSRLDAPAGAREAYRAVERLVPAGERVLSLATYDTYYYSRRPATWPLAWGQEDHPVEMFLTSDCDSVLAGLHRHRLHYLLLSRVPQGEVFDGTNTPRPFIECIGHLIDQEHLEILWSDQTQGLLRVRER